MNKYVIETDFCKKIGEYIQEISNYQGQVHLRTLGSFKTACLKSTIISKFTSMRILRKKKWRTSSECPQVIFLVSSTKCIHAVSLTI